MANQITVSFRVNGRPVEITAARNISLLYVLRNDFNLRGTRLGCGQGHCGACTVTLDGNPLTSCDLPLWAVEGKAVTTVETLTGDPPHPLVTAVINRQAGQCGYCLPGILMRASALIDRDRTYEEIVSELDANLCRCGAHTRLLAAVADVISARRNVPA